MAVDQEGYYAEEGDFRIAGVKGTGSEIKLAFVDPAGAVTGKLFPTGNPEDTIVVDTPRATATPFSVQATLIDVANPFVIVNSSSLPLGFLEGSPEWLDMIEDIRRKAAIMMDLAETTEQAALTRGTPKVLLVSPPYSDAASDLDPRPNIFVLAMSMGQIHPSVQLTGAVCLGAASFLKGTVVHKHFRGNSRASLALNGEGSHADATDYLCTRRKIHIAHRSGQIPVEVHLDGEQRVDRCSVSRTARKLFEGNVLFYV